ncbi:MAG: hypothetical protein QXR22_00390 [Acidilobaceae archaeon]
MDVNVFTVLSLALIDSIEPCLFALYTGIIASIASTNLFNIIRVSTAFISSVFLGYFTFDSSLGVYLLAYLLVRLF